MEAFSNSSRDALAALENDGLLPTSRRCLHAWGLTEPECLEVAAGLVARAVLDSDVEPTARAVAEHVSAFVSHWVEIFATLPGDGPAAWFWRARRQLQRFPQVFLLTPLPDTSACKSDSRRVPVLPEASFTPMLQQSIDEPVERARQAMQRLAKQIGNVTSAETVGLVRQSS